MYPSTLSSQIQRLEDELRRDTFNTVIIARVKLTEYGEKFLQVAKTEWQKLATI